MLRVDHAQALALHLEQERRLDDVDAHRLIGEPEVLEEPLELAYGGGHEPCLGGDRTA